MVASKEKWDPFDHLKTLKGYSNEIPPEIIHSDSPDNRYKVRKGWFIAVSFTLDLMVQDGLIKIRS